MFSPIPDQAAYRQNRKDQRDMVGHGPKRDWKTMGTRGTIGHTDPRRNIYIYGMGGVFVLGTLGYYFKPDTRWDYLSASSHL